MSSAFIDPSALAALAFGEPEGGAVQAVLRSVARVYASLLAEAELRAALARERVDPAAADALLAGLHWVVPDRRLTGEIDRALAAGRLRGADLHHVACALYLADRPGDLPFVTLDGRQRRVASRLGFPDPLRAPTARWT